MKFEGIYTPIVTPYRDDYSIDYERLAEIVDFLIDGGLVIPSTRRGSVKQLSWYSRQLLKLIIYHSL